MSRRRFDIAELLNAAGLAGLIVVLLVAYADQFAGHDLPCPLCLLQRVAIAGVAFGLLLNLRYGPQPSSYGIMLLAALFGMAVAGRQILLHIAPGTGSYGAPLFGLHFYTWSFLLFAAVILGTAILLLLPRPTSPGAAAAAATAVRAGLGGDRRDRAQRGDDLPAVRAAGVSRQSGQLLGVRALRRRRTASVQQLPATRLLSVLELIARKDVRDDTFRTPLAKRSAA